MNLDAVKFDAFYLVKLIFGKYFYFDANHIANLLQLDAICVALRKRARERPKGVCEGMALLEGISKCLFS